MHGCSARRQDDRTAWRGAWSRSGSCRSRSCTRAAAKRPRPSLPSVGRADRRLPAIVMRADLSLARTSRSLRHCATAVPATSRTATARLPASELRDRSRNSGLGGRFASRDQALTERRTRQDVEVPSGCYPRRSAPARRAELLVARARYVRRPPHSGAPANLAQGSRIVRDAARNRRRARRELARPRRGSRRRRSRGRRVAELHEILGEEHVARSPAGGRIGARHDRNPLVGAIGPCRAARIDHDGCLPAAR